VGLKRHFKLVDFLGLEMNLLGDRDSRTAGAGPCSTRRRADRDDGPPPPGRRGPLPVRPTAYYLVHGRAGPSGELVTAMLRIELLTVLKCDKTEHR
jgi:hypothetical protein